MLCQDCAWFSSLKKCYNDIDDNILRSFLDLSFCEGRSWCWHVGQCLLKENQPNTKQWTAMQRRRRKKKVLAEMQGPVSWNLADFNKITVWWILHSLHDLFDRLRMREEITAKDTSRNLVLYKNLTDLCQVFLPNRWQILIIREQSPGLKF